MLIMPSPSVPNTVWEIAETEEMKQIVGLYGKTYHFWQVDRGDVLPLGRPELMMSFTKSEQVSNDFVTGVKFQFARSIGEPQRN